MRPLKLFSWLLVASLAGCFVDRAPSKVQSETPDPVKVSTEDERRERDRNRSPSAIGWDSPADPEATANLQRALREDRGKSVALGKIPMARGLKVGDPVERLKELFPQGPVIIQAGSSGYQTLIFHFYDEEPKIVVVSSYRDDIAIAAEAPFPKEQIEGNRLEPYAWSEVPAELERMKGANEGTSAFKKPPG